MKRLLLVTMFLVLLTSCNSDPDVVETPDGASIATCTAGQVFKYIYEDDVIYEFYTDDIRQSDDMMDIVQGSVETAGSMADFLTNTFGESVCVITTYYAPT